MRKCSSPVQIYFLIFSCAYLPSRRRGWFIYTCWFYRNTGAVNLYSCKPLFVFAYIFFEVVADNLAYGHTFLRGDDFEF